MTKEVQLPWHSGTMQKLTRCADVAYELRQSKVGSNAEMIGAGRATPPVRVNKWVGSHSSCRRGGPRDVNTHGCYLNGIHTDGLEVDSVSHAIQEDPPYFIVILP